MLYYEAHVTIEPVFGKDLAIVQNISECFGFRVADLLMKRDRDETEVRSDKDTFTTGRSEDLVDIMTRTKDLVNALVANQFDVYRYKIEDTLLDSRHSDPWGLIECQMLNRN